MTVLELCLWGLGCLALAASIIGPRLHKAAVVCKAARLLLERGRHAV